MPIMCHHFVSLDYGDIHQQLVSIQIMRLFVLIGLLFGLKKASKELTGTVIDYTGQIKPTPLREAPIAKMGEAFISIAQGIIDEDTRKLKEGLRTLSDTGKIFIPWYLAGKDLFDLMSGQKDIGEFMFYGKKKKKSKEIRLRR